MLDHQQFIDTILANPDDESPRLVYADWLEERGDARAEWLRLICESWKIAQNLRTSTASSSDVWTSRNELYTRDPSGRLVRVWANTCVRFQPIWDGTRLGNFLSHPAAKRGLAVGDLRLCNLIELTLGERVRSEIDSLMRGKRIEFAERVGLRLAYFSIFPEGDRAAEEASLVAVNSGSTRLEANQWQCELASMLLTLPLPPRIEDSESQ